MTIVRMQPRNNARHLFQTKNLNAQDERGFTCLHTLVMTGNDRRDTGLLRSLLERGADPTIRDTKSLTALDRACSLGRANMMKTLVEFGAPLHAHTAIAGRTPLHFSNESLQYQMAVPLLLQLGADVNVKSKHRGRTILHETILRHDSAANHSKTTVAHVQWLVQVCGADSQAIDHHGWTALHYAAFMGHEDLVAALLTLGANAQARDALGRTPLHVTGRKVPLPQWDEDITVVLEPSHQSKEEAEKAKQAHQVHIHHLNTTAKPTTTRSSSSSCVDNICRLLLQHGANAWTVDRQGHCTFFLAAQAEELHATFALVQAAALEGLFGAMTNMKMSTRPQS